LTSEGRVSLAIFLRRFSSLKESRNRFLASNYLHTMMVDVQPPTIIFIFITYLGLTQYQLISPPNPQRKGEQEATRPDLGGQRASA